jgi:hypothetical protein
VTPYLRGTLRHRSRGGAFGAGTGSDSVPVHLVAAQPLTATVITASKQVNMRQCAFTLLDEMHVRAEHSADVAA